MGWLKSLGRKLGRGIEKFGEFTGIDVISDWGRNIQDACAEKISYEKSYDKREANIYTTDRLNEILVSFSEGYLQQSTAIEKHCIRLVEDYCDKLIEIIENAPDSAHSVANLRVLKSGKGKITKIITGGIKEPLSKRMSLDDLECLEILKMDSGTEKNEAMAKFTKKIIKEALNNLSDAVRRALNEQLEDIEAYLGEVCEEQEKAMKVLKEHFDRLVKKDELEQSDKEKNCIQPLFIIDVTDYVTEILE